jgi:GTPase SAR1 family protein
VTPAFNKLSIYPNINHKEVTSVTRTRKHPIEFRKEEVGYVMERWRASESCSLVGVGSVGKSNLLQHLADEEVQTYYMKDVTKGAIFKAIIIDPSMLGPLPSGGHDAQQIRCWAGYELMMHRLYQAFYPLDILGEEARLFWDLYQTLQDGNNPLYAYMGLRYFELGLDLFMKRGIQIVFMFDEFEEMLRELPVKFFITLRGIRDPNKNQLSYLTFTRSPLADIVELLGIRALDIEPFVELFNDNLYYVGPYNDADARDMLRGLERRSSRKYDDFVINFLLWATGRYAGLLRASFRVLETLSALDSNTIMTGGEQIVHQLSFRRGVRVECATIWASLTPLEQTLLREFASPQPNINPNDLAVQQAYALLESKRLVRTQGGRVIIEPPLLNAFVASGADLEIE